jgi:hypothetical protein
MVGPFLKGETMSKKKSAPEQTIDQIVKLIGDERNLKALMDQMTDVSQEQEDLVELITNPDELEKLLTFGEPQQLNEVRDVLVLAYVYVVLRNCGVEPEALGDNAMEVFFRIERASRGTLKKLGNEGELVLISLLIRD